MEIKILDHNKKSESYNIDKPITGYDLLNKYGKNYSEVVAFLLNNQLKDLFWEVDNDATVQFVYRNDVAGWKVLNYGCALVLAYAVKNLYPDAMIALANTTDDGFYLDFDYEKTLKKEDLIELEKEMKRLLNNKFQINRVCQTLEESLKTHKNNKYAQEYAKLNHRDGLKCSYLVDKKLNIIASNVAINDSSPIKFFKLEAVTGAYWLGNDKNKQLQRISGICHWTKSELDEKVLEITTRKNRDHRILGEKLNIFTFNDDIGKGLPIFLPNGEIIKKELQKYLRAEEFQAECQEVATPVLGSVSLYQKSGHWDHYRENMFTPIEKEQEKLVLRPMTCPHHCMIYKSTPRSYRDLPLRLSEHALLYRYEITGALTGLERVRSMELTDCHIFARIDQMKSEFKNCYHLIDRVLKTLNIEIDYLSLSLRDPDDKEKYYNDDKMWNEAETALREVLDELKINYKEMIGEAAFYGPKFDVQIKTPLGHEITISTIQFDFLLPKKFNLTYTDSHGVEVNPVIVHRGLIGTYERFIATLLEQTQGVFPLWLAPKQVIILPVNNSEKVMKLTNELYETLKENEIRSTIFANETIGKRIKISHEQKIPYIVVIGEKEVENQKITYHTYHEQKKDIAINKDEFISLLKKAIKSKK